MKDLIIHIGYPKTATTTLQNLIFKPLHHHGEIHAPLCGGFALRNKLEQISHPIDTKLAYNLEFSSEDGRIRHLQVDSRLFNDQLSSSVVNIVSDETLAVPWVPVKNDPRFIAPRLRSSDATPMPTSLHRLFHGCDTNISVLVVLRNQIDLLQSLYAQRVERYPPSPSFDSASKFYFEQLPNDRPSLRHNQILEQFNFYNTISGYADVFGSENIHILLFEDLLHNKVFFIKQLAKIIKHDSPDYLEQLLASQPPRRVKLKKSANEYVLPLTVQELILGKRLASTLKPYYSSAVSLIDRITPKGFTFKSFIKSLPMIKKRIEDPTTFKTLPPFSEIERLTIFDYFRPSNVDLANKFSLDVELLGRYGYL